jgi:hypothetical protein
MDLNASMVAKVRLTVVVGGGVNSQLVIVLALLALFFTFSLQFNANSFFQNDVQLKYALKFK